MPGATPVLSATGSPLPVLVSLANITQAIRQTVAAEALLRTVRPCSALLHSWQAFTDCALALPEARLRAACRQADNAWAMRKTIPAKALLQLLCRQVRRYDRFDGQINALVCGQHPVIGGVSVSQLTHPQVD